MRRIDVVASATAFLAGIGALAFVIVYDWHGDAGHSAGVLLGMMGFFGLTTSGSAVGYVVYLRDLRAREKRPSSDPGAVMLGMLMVATAGILAFLAWTFWMEIVAQR